jgi:hypothetical protein
MTLGLEGNERSLSDDQSLREEQQRGPPAEFSQQASNALLRNELVDPRFRMAFLNLDGRTTVLLVAISTVRNQALVRQIRCSELHHLRAG